LAFKGHSASFYISFVEADFPLFKIRFEEDIRGTCSSPLVVQPVYHSHKNKK